MSSSTMAGRAELAFQQLLALDAHYAERQELAASGVPASTIDALFESDFAGLLPGLCARVDELGLMHLMKDRLWDSLNENLRGMKRSLGPQRHDAMEQQMTDDERRYGPLKALREYIEGACLGMDHDREALKMARAIWYAHWFMSRVDSLSLAAQNQTRWLMLWVQENVLSF